MRPTSRACPTTARTSGRRWLGLSAACATLLAAGAGQADPSELPPAFAYNYGVTETPRAAGMGGALRALGTGVNSPFLNPANMGLARTYHIAALGQFTPEAARQAYGGVIVDSTRRWAGGVSVVGGFMDPDGIDRSYIDVRLAAAFAITKSLHLGLAGRYLSLEQEGLGPLGSSLASGGLLDPDDAPSGRSALVDALSFDAGLTIRATDELHLGFVGQNLSYPNNGLLPTVVGGGIGWGTRDYSIEVDAVADLASYQQASPRVMAGGEYLVADRVPLRLGYRFDLLRGSGYPPSHQLSGGAGYLDRRFGVEVSVRRTLVGPSATNILVSLSYFLDAVGVPATPPQ